MHDSLDYLAHEPVHRAYHHGEMTFSLVYAWTENFVLPLSHDEVVHGKGSLLRKMPGDRWQQLANLRAYLAFMWAHPGKQLLFMGGELGQESEWAESRELDWWLLDHPEHRGVSTWSATSTTAYVDSPALWARDHDPAGFQWIDANDAGRNVFSFVRRGDDRRPRPGLRRRTSRRCPTTTTGSGCPPPGEWDEVLNTDAEAYAGSGVGNLGVGHRGRRRLVRPAAARRPSSSRRWRRCGSAAGLTGAVGSPGSREATRRRGRLTLTSAHRRRAVSDRGVTGRPAGRRPDQLADALQAEGSTSLDAVSEDVDRRWRDLKQRASRRWSTPTTRRAQRIATWSGLQREGVMRGVTVDGATGRPHRLRPARHRRPGARAGGLPGAAQLVPAAQARDRPDAGPRRRRAGCCCAS